MLREMEIERERERSDFKKASYPWSLKLGLKEKVRSTLSEPRTMNPRATLCPLRQQACWDGKSFVLMGRGTRRAGPASSFSGSSGHRVVGWAC